MTLIMLRHAQESHMLRHAQESHIGRGLCHNWICASRACGTFHLSVSGSTALTGALCRTALAYGVEGYGSTERSLAVLQRLGGCITHSNGHPGFTSPCLDFRAAPLVKKPRLKPYNASQVTCALYLALSVVENGVHGLKPGHGRVHLYRQCLICT